MNIRNRPLTARQQTIMQVLASRGTSTVRDLVDSGFGFEEGTIRSILHSLGRRGYVDVMGFDYSRNREARTYGLTRLGEEVEATLLADPDEAD